MHKITNPLRASFSKFGWRRILFTFVVLAYLGWLGLINMLLFLPDWLRWLPYGIADKISAMGHLDFTDTHNLIHEFVFALIFGTAAVGLLVQLWKPLKNVVGQLIALIAWVTLILAAVITNNWVPQPLFITFGGLTLLATILHPAGRGLFNWFSVAKINRILIALIIIAAVPLLAFAYTNIGLQIASGEATGFFGHSPPAFHGGAARTTPADIEAVKQRYGDYTVAQAEREGYILDPFCLDAGSFGQPAERGAMGFHATNETLLRGPIAAERPQALMFDAEGHALGVEYEVVTDAVPEPPQLFGQTFAKLPPHPGVEHEHYALHIWFVDNPNGQFADFNPRLSCPPDSTPPPGQTPGHGDAAMGNEGGMAADNEAVHDQEHAAMGHYRNMAAFSFIIILVGLLASFRPPGWRLAAWVAGFLPILLGLSSVVLPDAESSLGLFWGLAAIAWGVVFIVAAALTRDKVLDTRAL